MTVQSDGCAHERVGRGRGVPYRGDVGTSALTTGSARVLTLCLIDIAAGSYSQHAIAAWTDHTPWVTREADCSTWHAAEHPCQPSASRLCQGVQLHSAVPVCPG